MKSVAKYLFVCAYPMCQMIQNIHAYNEANNNYPIDSYGSQYQYSSQHQASPSTDYPQEEELQQYYATRPPIINERQDFIPGGSITNVVGPEASALAAVVGAVFASVAVVGVLANNLGIASLSDDQDKICKALKLTPKTKLTLTGTGSGAGNIVSPIAADAATSTQIRAQLNIIEQALIDLYEQNSEVDCE